MPDTYSQIYMHYVFAVKYRHALIHPSFEEKLYQYISGISRELNQTLLQINGMPDHVHILVRLRPAIAPSKFIQIVKQNSSRWLNEERISPRHFRWQRGGGIFSVSHDQVPCKMNYIKNQKNHHDPVPFKEEYLKLLEGHNIEFKDEYLLEFFE